jgi:ribosome maturation factor RimP
MNKPKNNTESIVRDLAEPIAAGLGLQLWDVRFVKEGANWYLRISIDKEGGVQITDCENMSRAIDPVLDEADPISQSYFLEVSSPGLGRPLTRPEHFNAMKGQEIAVHTIRPIDGCRDFTGKLTEYDGGITIDIDGISRTFAKNEIASVKLNDDADLF